jgi:hypothetical protein
LVSRGASLESNGGCYQGAIEEKVEYGKKGDWSHERDDGSWCDVKGLDTRYEEEGMRCEPDCDGRRCHVEEHSPDVSRGPEEPERNDQSVKYDDDRGCRWSEENGRGEYECV